MMFGLFGRSFNPDKEIPDLSGKVFFVTGGNNGLGKETILQLAKHKPAHIYLGARTTSKAEEAIQSIRATVPDAAITHISIDLTSFESVKAAADTFTSQSSRLDVLMNNAGIMATPPGETKEGYEIQFGTNHMGHALLTKLLLPTLRSTAALEGGPGEARVINVSSEGHNMAFGGILTDKAAMDAGGTWGRYGNSKLANILHAKGLVKNEKPEAAGTGKIIAVSIHPGVIHTDLYASSTDKNFITRNVMVLSSKLFLKSVAQGAWTQLWAATAPADKLTNGAYYTSPGGVSGGSASARSDKQRDDLWGFTEKELAGKGFL